MADKEATVYVLDVGTSMDQKRNGRDKTDLDWCMQYVWDKIATTVASDRKTLNIGVLGFRTDGTSNPLEEDDAYSHITVFQHLSQILMSNIRSLADKIKPAKSPIDGDPISALVVAIDMIERFCKKLKYRRKIVLITNADSALDAEDLDSIVEKIKVDNIDLVILGVDFDDADYGCKEEDKTPTKERNEDLLHKFAGSCKGVCGTMAQAVDQLGIPETKVTRPVPLYKGTLTLGDAETYDSAITINVERFPKTMQARARTASNFVLKPELTQDVDGDTTMTNGHSDAPNELSLVRNNITYQVKDEDAPGGKKDVSRDDLAKGYEYGSTAVPISASEENITKLETKPGLEILGFVAPGNFQRYMALSRSCVIVAMRTDDLAAMALSSFIHTLYENDRYAVARHVAKEGKSPILLLLAPSIQPEFECLLDVELPFAEDIRSYRFPPLDRIITVSGKKVIEHRNLPSEYLQEAMAEYVEEMDLSNSGKTDEGEPTEYMPLDETYSPILHRINQAVKFRATQPNQRIPPPYDAVTKYQHPPKDLLEKAQPSIKRLSEAANVKKVPPKALAKRRYRQQEQPRSGLDVGALLSSRSEANKHRISPDNAIPEFKQIMLNAESISVTKDAVTQFGKIVEDWVKNSMGSSAHGRVIEALGVIREECVEIEEPGVFNDFVRSFKKKISDGELNGDRRELWWEIRKSKLGLIDKKLSSVSKIEEAEAKEFLMPV
ncbi:MAG: ATP-dependent DNA helicase II subunit 2 [Chrysothrix sp. TS-e1954]|nr:MAG: ATP-dependent DNA helicase II subunit 2 [Chrysothrix sp. TS-e1954]